MRKAIYEAGELIAGVELEAAILEDYCKLHGEDEPNRDCAELP